MKRTAPPEGTSSRPVLLYVGVMFAVAMLLLLLSFLMQQRNHEALMDSVGSVQSVVDLELQVEDLEDALAAAELARSELEGTLATTEQALALLQDQQEALLLLAACQSAVGEEAKALLAQLDGAKYRTLLAEIPLPDGRSALALYEQLTIQEE